MELKGTDPFETAVTDIDIRIGPDLGLRNPGERSEPPGNEGLLKAEDGWLSRRLRGQAGRGHGRHSPFARRRSLLRASRSGGLRQAAFGRRGRRLAFHQPGHGGGVGNGLRARQALQQEAEGPVPQSLEVRGYGG